MVAYLAKSDDNTNFHQIVDFLSSWSINYALTVSPTLYASYIGQFWNTASSKTINSVKQMHVIGDGKAVVISESSVRSDLLVDDEDAITCLTNDEIFKNLALIGYEPLSTKLTSQKGGSYRCQETMGGTPAQTRSERVLEQPNEPPLSEGHTFRSEEGRMEKPIKSTDNVPPTTYDSPLTGGYTPGSNEGRLKHLELMNTYTALSNRVTTLENELSSTKTVYHKAFITLTKRVKKLETKLKHKRSRAVIHSSDEEEPSLDAEDSPKQGRIIIEIDKDETINLVSEQGEVQETAKPLKDNDDATLAKTLLNIKRSTTKDKGKGIMQETKLPRKIKKRKMIQLSLDEELAQKLHAEELAKETKLDEKIEEEVKAYADTDQEIEEMKLYVKIVPDEDIGIDAILLATKPLVIVEYKIVQEGKISTYHIIRANGSTKRYTLIIKLLENIDREDLETLWKLVKDKHRNTRTEEDYERVL
nr:hypothetical protein [Tanacetum cinerariifolium]